MEYIKIEEVPKDRLPIYFCNAKINITETKSNKRVTFNRVIEKVVLKGLDEDALIKSLTKKRGDTFLSKRELKNSKVTSIKIQLIDSLGFGVME